MKTLFKNRLLPFLLVAITALCALFGVILTTPSPVRADASTTPYDKELGFEVKKGDNLFGKYVAAFSNVDNYSRFVVGPDGAWDFFVEGEGAPFLYVSSTKSANEITNEVVFDFEYLENLGCYMAVFDFTKEYSFEFDTGNGIVNIVLNEETLNVVNVLNDNENHVVMYYPTSEYSSKELTEGDNLAGKTLICPCVPEGCWWQIDLENASLYWEGDLEILVNRANENEEFDPVFFYVKEAFDVRKIYIYDSDRETNGSDEYFAITIPETYSVDIDGEEYVISFMVRSASAEEDCDGDELSDFTILDFSAVSETPDVDDTPDTPNEPTDGEEPKDDNGNIKDKINDGSDKIADWLNDNTGLAFTGSGVLVIGAIILAVIFFKKK